MRHNGAHQAFGALLQSSSVDKFARQPSSSVDKFVRRYCGPISLLFQRSQAKFQKDAHHPRRRRFSLFAPNSDRCLLAFYSYRDRRTFNSGILRQTVLVNVKTLVNSSHLGVYRVEGQATVYRTQINPSNRTPKSGPLPPLPSSRFHGLFPLWSFYVDTPSTYSDGKRKTAG
jgi:hypothetical protein